MKQGGSDFWQKTTGRTEGMHRMVVIRCSRTRDGDVTCRAQQPEPGTEPSHLPLSQKTKCAFMGRIFW